MTDTSSNLNQASPRVLMLGTFGLRPKGTMSARAAGIASALQRIGWNTEIVTVPWDNPGEAGSRGSIDGVPFVNTHTVRPALWPIAVTEMVREARRFRPDIVHLFKPKGFGDLAARALRRMGFPLVVDMDDWEGSGGWNDALPYSELQRLVFDWQERSGPAMADGVTVASTALQQRAIDLGADHDRILYLPNCLTANRMKQLLNPPIEPSRAYSALPETGPNILVYTRFVEFPPEFPVEVLANLREFGHQANLVIAGTSPDGAAEQRLLARARTLNLENRISTLGWIDPGDLGWIADQCDAALVPFEDTLINRSKCSVKLLELIACGIPVIASNVGENRSYLAGVNKGYLARPGSVEHHAEQLNAALSSTPSTGRPTGRQSERNARGNVDRWTWDSVSGDIAAHYRCVIDETRVGQP